MTERIITTEFTEEDVSIEAGLRPQMLSDYIGQQKVKENLKIFILSSHHSRCKSKFFLHNCLNSAFVSSKKISKNLIIIST